MSNQSAALKFDALAPKGQLTLQQWLVSMGDGALGSFASYVERNPE